MSLELKSKANVYTVSKINSYIEGFFYQENLFHSVHVKGEIGTLKPWEYGLVYLNLKEGESVLPCRLSKKCVETAGFKLENGMTVTLIGDIVANTKKGSYFLKAERVLNDETVGKDAQMLAKLKAELFESGMFDPQYKKPVPKGVKILGFVTSESGAVIHDVIRVSKEIDPYIQIVLYPCKVSGSNATEGIIRGIRALENYGAEVIIVGRGGGSDEDLWVYNNREIAEAVFECGVPVISAVGHGRDYTILDMVADHTAATPSHAAKMAVTDINSSLERLKAFEDRYKTLMHTKITLNNAKLAKIESQLKGRSPYERIQKEKLFLEGIRNKLCDRMRRKLDNKKHKLGIYIEKYKGLSPLEKLSQGYSYVSVEGKTLSSVEDVKTEDSLDIYVKDGLVRAKVLNKEKLSFFGGEDGRKV